MSRIVIAILRIILIGLFIAQTFITSPRLVQNSKIDLGNMSSSFTETVFFFFVQYVSECYKWIESLKVRLLRGTCRKLLLKMK
jgi:hypothetical protein